jgi:A/G-specific adenine glycosylase
MKSFSERLLAWHAAHGRHDLPWQQNRSLYRVWVSEIMLQQTQVGTVIPYFERFLARFPDIGALAAAPEDEVLHLWTGLGYYARARNLHRAAKFVVATHAGEFPTELAAAQALPGIGRSTAAAILAQALGQRHPILDGNVKRVLARRHLIGDDLQAAATVATLWQLADAATPNDQLADYTQAIMDLGATCCTRSRPACDRCPVVDDCAAYRAGRQREFPRRKSARTGKRTRIRRRTLFLLAMNADGAVLLERRPPSGIWGGLWCPPEFADAEAARRAGAQLLGLEAWPAEPLPTIEHSFTHFDLDIEPWLVRVARRGDAAGSPAFAAAVGGIAEPRATIWYNAAQPAKLVGLPAPVKSLLEQLT